MKPTTTITMYRNEGPLHSVPSPFAFAVIFGRVGNKTWYLICILCVLSCMCSLSVCCTFRLRLEQAVCQYGLGYVTQSAPKSPPPGAKGGGAAAKTESSPAHRYVIDTLSKRITTRGEIEAKPMNGDDKGFQVLALANISPIIFLWLRVFHNSFQIYFIEF